jgi:hypothetical protein
MLNNLRHRWRIKALWRERLLKVSMADIFSRMYERNSWGSEESVSGEGSTFAQTRTIREELPLLIKEIGAKSLLDAPCGDFHWMRETKLDLDSYIGCDIVPDLVARNQRLYGSKTVRFEVLDLTTDRLPRTDLILCRDCLVHLPFKTALSALKNFKSSGSTYLLITTYPGLLKKNSDLLITGNWRPLDLQLPPFALPKSIKFITEKSTEADDYAEKSLGLWRLEDIRI